MYGPVKQENVRPSLRGACCHRRADNKLRRIERRIARLLNVPSDYHILLFNLDHQKGFNVFSCLKPKENSRCGFLDAGARSSFAINQAKRSHQVEIVSSSKASNYRYVPKTDWIPFNLSFLHYTSTNETEGNRKTTFPKLKTPLLLDISLDLFSTRVQINYFSLIYARGENQVIPGKLCLVIVQNRFLTNVGDQLLTHPALLGTCGHPPGILTTLFLFEHNLRQMEESGGVTPYRLRCEKLSNRLYKEIERNTKFCT